VGRPKAENPKDKELRVRIDKETEQTLKELAQHYNVSVSVVVRMGIERLYAEIKK
jgi:predicted DNA-binding protein